MSNSLVKIIDSSLLPAVLLVFAKFFGVYFAAKLFGVDLGIAEDSNLFNLTPLVPHEQLQLISSYSDLIMFILIASGFLVVLIRAVYLHDSHINIKTIRQLTDLNLLDLIRSSYELYHNAVTWFLFNWIAVALILINYLLGKTYAWIFYAAFLFTIALTLALFRDILKELELTKKRLLKNSTL